MWGLIQQEKSPKKKRNCPPSQHRTLRPLSIYLGHSTLGVDLSDSWASERNLLFSLQAFSNPDVRLLNCEFNFFVFLLSFAFFSPLGHARYDITLARGKESQYRHRIASKARSTRYLLYVAYTPCVASTVRLVLMCTCILRASTFTSNLFCCRSFSFHLWDLQVLVSYIELLFTTDFVVE